MECWVGALDKREATMCYKRLSEREIDFECKVVVYGHSHKDYELIKSICS
jgi:predicted phosphodiesterase